MNRPPYFLTSAPEPVRLLASYAQWSAALRADNPEWLADGLPPESLDQLQSNFGGVNLQLIQKVAL